jgi:hypothetical protein
MYFKAGIGKPIPAYWRLHMVELEKSIRYNDDI